VGRLTVLADERREKRIRESRDAARGGGVGSGGSGTSMFRSCIGGVLAESRPSGLRTETGMDTRKRGSSWRGCGATMTGSAGGRPPYGGAGSGNPTRRSLLNHGKFRTPVCQTFGETLSCAAAETRSMMRYPNTAVVVSVGDRCSGTGRVLTREHTQPNARL
jgi:hypothetical protein